jgi:hypothetical protein
VAGTDALSNADGGTTSVSVGKNRGRFRGVVLITKTFSKPDHEA